MATDHGPSPTRGSRFALPLLVGSGAFLLAAVANVMLIVGLAGRSDSGDFISAYALALVSDLVIAAALIVAATIVRNPS